MRIVLVDKNLIDPVNHAKWARLAARPRVSLSAVTPERWVENFRPLRFDSARPAAFPIEPLPVVWPGYENRGFYLRGLGGVVRRAAPETLILFEEPFSLFALQGVLAARRHAPKARIVLYSYDNLSKGRNFPYRPRQAYAAIERWVMQRAHLLLTANEEARAQFAERYPVPVRKLYFGLDLAAFAAPAEPPPRPEGCDFLVGYVGRLLPMKGIDTLIEAVASLPDDVHLSLVGGGPDRERLGALIAERGLTRRARIHSAVPSAEVPARLTGLDALVLPSRTTPGWKEQYGRVLVEAMAAEVPVLGSSSGAIPEVIGDAGIVFPEGDAAALAGHLERLRSDEAERVRLGHAGGKRKELFTAESFARNLEAFLTEIAAPR
jgi:glycosyltransferase involved in cell wall biosynthesis